MLLVLPNFKKESGDAAGPCGPCFFLGKNISSNFFEKDEKSTCFALGTKFYNRANKEKGGETMGYQVKWIQENLGITRKALRTYEDKGLIPKNEHGKYRNYSDNEIQAIWEIKVINSIGYSLNEIRNIINNQDYDFLERLPEKIEKLYKEKEEIEKRIGYAEMIKLTGRFPSMPKKLGTVKFKDFYQNSLEKWNINSDNEIQAMKKFVDSYLNFPSNNYSEEDVEKLLNCFSAFTDKNELLAFSFFINDAFETVIEHKEKGENSPEIQELIRSTYENMKKIPQLENLTTKNFVRYLSSFLVDGDIAKANHKIYGKENCIFIADALALFGGYANHLEIED